METINYYILKLEKLSRYYQGQEVLEQKELYNSILNGLRELYRRQPKDFTDQTIAEINKLKVIIKSRGSHKIKNCYFNIDNEFDKIVIYVNTPVDKYSFFNNILLNSKLESDEIQIKMNDKQEIIFIFDKIKKVYLYPSINQKIIRYIEDYTYKFKHVYFNCNYYKTYTQSYKDLEGININFMGNQDYITYKMDDVLIKYYVYNFGTFKIIDKTGKNVFYFNVSIEEEDRDMFEHIIPKDYETNINKIAHNYKNDIKVKLLNIVKNEYKDKDKDSLVTELKEYIFYYLNILNNHIDGVESDIPPPELRIEYMYEYICSAIDEIIECKTEEVLNYNLKLIYKLIEDDDGRFDFDEEYYDEYM